MPDFFKQAAYKIRSSPYIIPIYAMFIALMVIGIGLFIEDYNTSLYGYREIPTRKVGEYVNYLVALLPQVGQITFLYMFLSRQDRWAMLLGLSLWLVDTGTDTFYKMNGQFGLLPVAFVESVLIYTVGSEFAVTVAFGMLIELFPDCMRGIQHLFNMVMDGLGIFVEGKDDGNRKPQFPPQSQRPLQPQRPPQPQNPQQRPPKQTGLNTPSPSRPSFPDTRVVDERDQGRHG